MLVLFGQAERIGVKVFWPHHIGRKHVAYQGLLLNFLGDEWRSHIQLRALLVIVQTESVQEIVASEF